MGFPRLIVLGLDGASPDLVGHLIHQGELPNLARLQQDGVAGPLETTLPPDSWLAWPSFATGTGPGKHGVFSYYAPGKRLAPEAGPVDATCLRTPAVWDLLTQAGLSSCVINVPVTYPPHPIKGCLIAGTPRPRERRDFIFPAEFAQDLAEEVEELDAVERWREVWRQGRTEAALSHLRCSTRRLLACAERAADRFRPNLLVLVLAEIDRVQHWLPWPRRPDQAETWSADQQMLRECYRLADAALGELRTIAGDDTSIFVLSDHGAAACDHSFFPNQFLEETGFLRRLSAPRLHLRSRSIRERLRRLRMKRLAQRLGPWADRKLSLPRLKREALWLKQTDWTKTRAYASIRQCRDGIFINLVRREPNGIVEPGADYERVRREVAEALCGLRNPDTGEPVVEGVWLREEVYTGPYLEEAPDLVFSPYRGAYLQDDSLRRRGCLGPPPAGYGACHRSPAIWSCAGPAIRPAAQGRRAHITDLAPTILYLLGLPVPQHMDGRVLTEILEPALVAHRPVERGPAVPPRAVEKPGYSEQEEQEILRRLRDLGYF